MQMMSVLNTTPEIRALIYLGLAAIRARYYLPTFQVQMLLQDISAQFNR